ncbi:hypothetical protein D3C84_1084050 [compost metagenome]
MQPVLLEFVVALLDKKMLSHTPVEERCGIGAPRQAGGEFDIKAVDHGQLFKEAQHLVR